MSAKAPQPKLPTSELALQRISPQESLSRQIARQLGDQIARGKIEVGAKLPTETRLCELFGVSRTAVREAIALLRSQGLIETQRGVGSRVVGRERRHASPVRHIRATTVEEILQVLELRMGLEPQAASLAAQRHTPQEAQRLQTAHSRFVEACRRGGQARQEDYRFHRTIIEATHNPCFLALYQPLHQEAIPRARLLAGEMEEDAVGGYLERIEHEHEAVLMAILSGDGDAAFAAMQRHFDRPYQMYASYQMAGQMAGKMAGDAT